MTRNTHNDLADHEELRVAADVPYDNTVSGLTADEVQAAIDEIVAGGTGGGGMEDLLTGNDQNFTASVGNWTNSGGTLTRDTTYKVTGATASLKYVTSAQNQYVEVPVSGTFEADKDYYAMVLLSWEETTGTIDSTMTFGLIGTDSNSQQPILSLGAAGQYPWQGNGNFAAFMIHWRPTADRTGVKVRVNRNSTTGTKTYHVGVARAVQSPTMPIFRSPGTDAIMLMPYTDATDVSYGPWTDDSLTGVQFNVGGTQITSTTLRAGHAASEAAGSSTSQIWAEHAAGSLADKGIQLSVGTGYLGVRVSQKDSSTIQMYPDVSGGYDIELRDRGSGKFWYAVDTSGNRVPLSTLMTGGIQFIIGGAGTTITTGIKGDIEMPFAGVLTAVRLFADQSGSIVLDLWKDTYANYPPVVGDSITASAKPTISSTTKSQDTTLTGWTTTFAAGDTIRVNVDSATTVTRVTMALRFRRT